MGYAQHVGRVGALAVALGIGTAVIAAPWQAAAAPADAGSASSASSDTTEGHDAGDTTTRPADTAGTDTPSDSEPDPVAHDSDQTDTPTAESDAEEPDADIADNTDADGTDTGGSYRERSHRVAVSATDTDADTHSDAPDADTAGTDGRRSLPDEPAVAGAEPAAEPEPQAPVAATAEIDIPDDTTEPSAPEETEAVGLAALLAPLVAPGAGGLPVQSPAEWALLAWARRQLGTPDAEPDTDDGGDDEPTVSLMASRAVISVDANVWPTIDDVEVDEPGADGVITGMVIATDSDQDPLTYGVSAGPTTGGFAINPNTGAFTYAPDPDVRHAAALDGAAAVTDSAVVTVSDGRGGTDAETIPLAVTPANIAPTGAPTYGPADSGTGAVTGSLHLSDGDDDAVAYTLASGPAKGGVVFGDNGSFTYTPTAAARQNATSGETDSFILTLTDGHGGTTPLTVSVPVTAVPSADPWAQLIQFIQRTFFNESPTATPVQIRQLAGGVVEGSIGADDPDGDPLLYTVTQGPANGTVVVNADGSYVYTPNTALAGAGGDDSFTVTVTEANAADHIHGAQGLLSRLISALTGGQVVLPDGSSITVAVPVHVTKVSTGVVGTIDNLSALPQWLVFNDAGTRAYVVNLGADNVSVIDTATGSVIGTVQVGQGPSTIWRQPGSTLAWLTNRDANSVSVLDTATGAVEATVGVGATPLEIGFSPDGATAYVTNGGSSSVTVIDTATRTVLDTFGVGAQPAGVAVTRDGQYLYVANQVSQNLLIFSRSTGALVADVAMGAHPTVIAFNHDGSTAYITNEFSDQVYLVSTATRTVVGTISVGTTPIGIVFNSDGSRAYVTNFAGRSQNQILPGTVSVIDTATNAVISTITVGYGPVSSAITPDGSQLWVVNSGGSISIIALGGSTPTLL